MLRKRRRENIVFSLSRTHDEPFRRAAPTFCGDADPKTWNYCRIGFTAPSVSPPTISNADTSDRYTATARTGSCVTGPEVTEPSIGKPTILYDGHK